MRVDAAAAAAPSMIQQAQQDVYVDRAADVGLGRLGGSVPTPPGALGASGASGASGGSGREAAPMSMQERVQAMELANRRRSDARL